MVMQSLGKLLIVLGVLAIIGISVGSRSLEAIPSISLEVRICYYAVCGLLITIGYFLKGISPKAEELKIRKESSSKLKDRYFYWGVPLILLLCGITGAAATKPTNSAVSG